MSSIRLTAAIGDWRPWLAVDIDKMPSQARQHFDALIASMGDMPLPILDYGADNPGPDGRRRFCSQIMGPHKNPILEEEPDGGWPCPERVAYVDPYGAETGRPPLKIVGAIFHEDDRHPALLGGKPPRFSFSNPNAPELSTFNTDGSITVGGRQWHLVRVHAANAPRIKGLVGYFRPTKPNAVIVSELGDVGV